MTDRRSECSPLHLFGLPCSSACYTRGCAWKQPIGAAQALEELECLCLEVIEELESALDLDYGPDQARELGREFRQELRTILRQIPLPPEPDPLASRPVAATVQTFPPMPTATPRREGGPAI